MFELQVHQAHRRRVLLFERTQLMASDTDIIQEVIQEVMETTETQEKDLRDDLARDATNDAANATADAELERLHELEQARMADEGCPNFEDDK